MSRSSLRPSERFEPLSGASSEVLSEQDGLPGAFRRLFIVPWTLRGGFAKLSDCILALPGALSRNAVSLRPMCAGSAGTLEPLGKLLGLGS